MADQKLNVQLTLDANGMVQGLTVATKGVDTAAQSIKRSFKGASEGAEGMASSLKGLRTETGESASAVEEFTHHVRGIRQEAFLGNFMARQIAEIGIASKVSAGEVTNLVSAFALGGGLGVAIEVTKMLVKEMMNAGEETKKLQAEAAKTAKEWREQTYTIVAGITGQTQANNLFHTQVVTSAVKEFDLKQKLLKANGELTEAEGRLAEARRAKNSTAEIVEQGQVDTARGVVEELNEQLKVQQELKKAASENVAHVDVAERGKAALSEFEKLTEAAARYGAERGKIDQMVAQKSAALLAQTLDGNEKLEAEYIARLLEIDQTANQTEIQRARLKNLTLMAYRKQLADYAKDQAQQWAEQEKKWIDANVRAQRGATEAIKHFVEDRDAYQLKRAEAASHAADERSRKDIEAFRQETGVAKQFGDTIGQAFSGLIVGSKSGAQAFTDLASAGVKAMFELEIKAVETAAITQAQNALRATSDVQANAADAASGAAASMASIPFVGPALAIGAMVAMEAAVLGLLSLIPKASGGFNIPTNIGSSGMLITGHAGEKILPRKQTEGLDRLIASGGGGETHLHFHSVFPPDREGLRKVLNSPEYTAERQAAQRLGKG